MPRFRKKPVVIEAVRWTGANRDEIAKFLRQKVTQYDTLGEGLRITTKEGVMTAPPGYWIIKGVEGEFYPCDPVIFDKTYDRVGQRGRLNAPT